MVHMQKQEFAKSVLAKINDCKQKIEAKKSEIETVDRIIAAQTDQDRPMSPTNPINLMLSYRESIV